MSRKGENIYKRKDSRWEARYIKFYDNNGEAQYGYCYGKSYHEAKEKLAAAKVAFALGKTAPTKNEKKQFARFCDEWLKIIRNRVKESTLVKYSCILEKHIKPHLGDCPFSSLSTVMIEEFSNKLLFEDEMAVKSVKDILPSCTPFCVTRRSVLAIIQKGSRSFTPKKAKKKREF